MTAVKKLASIVVNKNYPNLFKESAQHISKKIAENIDVRAPPTIVCPIYPNAKFVLIILFELNAFTYKCDICTTQSTDIPINTITQVDSIRPKLPPFSFIIPIKKRMMELIVKIASILT